MYAKNLHRWLVPYLQRCESREPGAYDRLLRDFVLTRARGDLQGVIQVFEASKSEVSIGGRGWVWVGWFQNNCFWSYKNKDNIARHCFVFDYNC